jgi:uncharacterized delta-60 repeat protein
VAIQADGKIVLAGIAGDDAAVYRLNANGSLDPTFGRNGRVTIDSGRSEVGAAVAIQPDGKIVVAGSSGPGGADAGDSDVVVYRLEANGALDGTFGVNGTVKLDGGAIEVGRAMALQPDGRILVAGITIGVGGADAVVYRLAANGSLDATFGRNGKVIVDGGQNEVAFAMALQPDGRIVVGGATSGIGPAHADALVYRLAPNGSLDNTFGRNGTVKLDSGGVEQVNGVAIQANGKIVLAGSTTRSSQAVVYRLAPSGARDTAFGGGGELELAVGGIDTANAVALDRLGRIILAGSSSANRDALVVRLTGDRLA